MITNQLNRIGLRLAPEKSHFIVVAMTRQNVTVACRLLQGLCVELIVGHIPLKQASTLKIVGLHVNEN